MQLLTTIGSASCVSISRTVSSIPANQRHHICHQHLSSAVVTLSCSQKGLCAHVLRLEQQVKRAAEAVSDAPQLRTASASKLYTFRTPITAVRRTYGCRSFRPRWMGDICTGVHAM